jgi:hypothetical protein
MTPNRERNDGSTRRYCVLIWIHLMTVIVHPQPTLPACKTDVLILFDSRPLLCPGYPVTFVKIGTIQRRLAWPLRKDDMIVREGTTFLLGFPPFPPPCQAPWLRSLKTRCSTSFSQLIRSPFHNICKHMDPPPCNFARRTVAFSMQVHFLLNFFCSALTID